MKNQKSVFEFGNEYQCTQYFDIETGFNGVDVSLDGEHIGSIDSLEVPEIEDEEENINFDNEVINWIVDNGY